MRIPTRPPLKRWGFREYNGEYINKIDMVGAAGLRCMHGPNLTSTRSTVTNVLDNTGVYRAVSVNKPAPYGARYISADVWSEYDVAGALLATTKGFVCGPGRTNLVPYSEDANQWIESGTCTVSSSGTIGGIASFQLTGQTAEWHRREFRSGTATGKHSISVHAGPGNQNNARITLRDTTAVLETRVDCNASNGSYNIVQTDAGAVTVEPEAVDGGYRFDCKFTPLNDGNNFIFAVGTGTATASDTIRTTGAQVEAGNAATAYIKTTGSPLARTADTQTIPIANFRDEMTITFKWTPHFNYDDLPLNTFSKGIITPTNTETASIAKYNRAGGGDGYISITDSSANTKLAVKPWAKDTTYNVCVSFSKSRGLQGICVAGTDSGDGTHAGFTLADVITFGLSANEEFTIKDVDFKPGWSNAATRLLLAPA